MDSCAKINMVYSLSSWGVCLVDLIISVLFFSGEEDSCEASLIKVDGHFYGPLVDCSQGGIVNKPKSRCKLKML